jgi:hypothetical protein
VGVACQGGKIRLGGGEPVFDILVQRELVIFDGQQIVPSAVQHDMASGLGLSVQGVQRDQPAVQVQAGKEFLGHGDLIGLGIDHRATQVILAGHADGAEHALTAAMFGLFAIQRDQLVFGGRATQAFLHFQQDLLELSPVNFLQQPPEGRLAGGGIAPPALANAQDPPVVGKNLIWGHWTAS